MRHEAIYSLYPQVVTVDDTAGAFDANGNQVTVDETLVAAEVARLQALEPTRIAEANRKAAYATESDPLFFKWQAGEATEAEWKAKRDEIRVRYPKEQA
jgi:hypothetical protein